MTLAGGSVTGPAPYRRNPRAFVIRGRPATLSAELQDRRDESVEITTLSPVIDNRRSNRQAAVDDRGRWNGNTGFLDIRHDAGIHGVAIVATVSKTHDIELDGCRELKLRCLLHAMLEILSEHAGSRDHGAQLRGPVDLEREPGLECAEAARQIGTEIAGPWRPGCRRCASIADRSPRS